MSVPERHERVIRALSAGGPAVPDTLRVPQPVARDHRRRPPVLVAVAASVVLATVVAVATFSGGGPSVEAVAAIGERPQTKVAPTSNGTLLRREFAGVTFPDWRREFGWMAIGGRSDTVQGRRAETMFYIHQGHRIAYTVVEGDRLEPPEGAATHVVDGVTLHHFRDGERDVVMFEREGRTCVLGGEVVHDHTLPDLATWRGEGAVDF
jgi:hypothetical protein